MGFIGRRNNPRWEARNVIRTLSCPRVCIVKRKHNVYGGAGAVSRNPADIPAAYNRVDDALGISEPTLSAPKWQLINVGRLKRVANIISSVSPVSAPVAMTLTRIAGC